jgi:hypothetical protein
MYIFTTRSRWEKRTVQWQIITILYRHGLRGVHRQSKRFFDTEQLKRGFTIYFGSSHHSSKVPPPRPRVFLFVVERGKLVYSNPPQGGTGICQP